MAQTFGRVVEVRHSEEPSLCGQWRLCALLGDAEVGLLDGRRACSWVPVHKDAHMVKASDYRQFRVAKEEQ